MLDYRSMLQTQLEQSGVSRNDIEGYLFTYDGLLAVSTKCTPKEAYEVVIGEHQFHLKSKEDHERARRLHFMGV